MVATRLFTVTILLGSFLLFLVQPMVGRMVLPRLGGSPQVWNSAMLFYQAVLLGGYFYAHQVNRLAPRAQTFVHVGLFLLAGLTLPVGIAALDVPISSNPAFWLLGLLAISIGPLFFVVSAQAPLMQAWYARADSGDPYPLYAASNVGSLAALLAYPTLVEPYLTLAQQSWLWSAGFVLLALLTTACAMRTRSQPVERLTTGMPPTWRDRLYWAALAAVPSGLLLATTTHLTTDIMAMPLLWVIPLALYLITFIIAFTPDAAPFIRYATKAAAPLLLVLGSYVFLEIGSVALLMAAAGLVLFFILALALHGTLAALRPAPAQLTEFYLWISIGGVIGGLFCALVAPVVFDWPYELPLLLVAAAILLPEKPLVSRIGRLWTALPTKHLLRWLLPPLALAGSFWVGEHFYSGGDNEAMLAVLVGIALMAIIAIGRRLAFGFYTALLMLALGGWSTIDISTMPHARERSFFGVYAIRDNRDDRVRELLNGTTLHGVQSTNPALATYPMSYYAPASGVGQVMSGAPVSARIGFVGLGTGTLACYAKPGQRWTVYEIDPTVVRIARDPRLFSYVSRCKPDLRIVLGDARLSLTKEPANSLDILAVDAFSSDAIPLHLLTREAFVVYRRALSRDGILLIHISNRHLDLEPVVAAIAKAEGWSAMIRDYEPDYVPTGVFHARSMWIALARDKATLNAALARDLVLGSDIFAAEPAAGWRLLHAIPGFRPWTDDYASILSVLKLQD